MSVAQKNSLWARRGKGLLSGLALLAALALAGCGGSGVGSASTSGPSVSVNSAVCNGCGTAMVSLSDAPGDFVSYLVTVDSLSLTRSDGTTVQIVPKATQVDFAQLVNLSEVIGAHEVPPGSYTSAQMTLDYSNATIVVSTASGNVTVPAADLINGSTGSAISAPMTVTLSFGGSPLVITDGTISNLALDFNLAASDTVDLTANPITVTVNPVLTANLTPSTTKQIHVRGALASVDTANSDYVVSVDPFDDQNENFGQLTVNTTTSTQFLINGASYTGSAGLAQLATLAANTMVTAYGTWDTTSKTFTASIVHAGTSVAIGSSNGVDGTVVARSGDTLTLSSVLAFGPLPQNTVTVTDPNDDMHFQQQVTVTVGSSTNVSVLGQTGTFSSADISVGQRVRFTGTLSVSGSSLTLDATSGNALLEPTNGMGLLTASAAGALTVNLETLGHMPASSLDFTGTGTSSTQDATASGYIVGIPATFSTSALTTGEPIQFTGFVTPFGSAPPDFAADAIVSYAQANADLKVTWPSPGSNTPFTTLTATGITLSQAMLQAASTHQIEIADSSIDVSTLANGITLVPATTSAPSSTTSTSWTGGDGGDAGDAGDQGYAVVHTVSNTVDSYSTFSAFVTALTSDLSSAAVLKVSAQGTYNANGTLTVSHMAVMLNN
ncbi:MAG: hypothetical protein ACYCT1_13930 [Steroidobacteraceae bacterium]